jgi:hypothetical protein
MQPIKTPRCYLSTSRGLWRVIYQEQPICADKETAADALAAAKQLKVTADPDFFWHGENGQFEQIEKPPEDTTAADYFTLTIQSANPQVDTTMTLF